MTPRTPGTKTLGADAAATARMLRRPFIPWQRSFADVALELRPDGRLRRRFIIVIVPRRAGKSLLMLAVALAITHHRHQLRAFYTSHRRETSAALWRDEWFPMLEESGLSPAQLEIRTANGSEAINWRRLHSGIRLLPPNGDAIRSASSVLALIDEGRELTIDQGRDIEAGAFPTQATGWGGQTWIVSNAGDASSEWLRGWRDRARAAIDDPSSPFALVEYAAPEGADPDDPATWWAAHPGLGYHVLEDVIAADHLVMDPDTFAAEYLGWWPETLIDRPLLDGWNRSTDPAARLVDPVTFAVELDLNRETVAITAAGAAPGGGWVIEVIECGAHGPWVAARLVELCEHWQPVAVVYDRGSPAAALSPWFDDLPAHVVALNANQVAAAVGAAHDLTLAGEVFHRDDVRLTSAVAAARRRPLTGGWTWDRRVTGIGPFLAGAFALWVARDGARRPPAVG